MRTATGRIYSILYGERFENRATVRAAELVKAGAIGRVLQTIGLGPHRITPSTRPAWFFDPARYGGILCDIASHQADQFLHSTGSTRAEIVAAQVGNLHHPQYPAFEDFGDMLLRGDGGTGYIRVDWFTPDGLSTWKDGRLTILGTDGYIEVRKNVTMLEAGQTSHAPHRHPNEELVIVKEGTVEVLVLGEWKRLGPGSVVFDASNQEQALRNAGAGPETYHVVNWRSPGTSQ